MKLLAHLALSAYFKLSKFLFNLILKMFCSVLLYAYYPLFIRDLIKKLPFPYISSYLVEVSAN